MGQSACWNSKKGEEGGESIIINGAALQCTTLISKIVGS